MTPTPRPDAAEVERLVAVLDALPALVHAKRGRRSARSVAGEIRVDGRPVSYATVHRCEAGAALSGPVLRAFLVWVGGEG